MVAAGVEAFDGHGTVFEQPLESKQTRNAFISGSAGWNWTDNSGAITVDTNEPQLFDSTVGGQVMLMTAGNPNTVGCVARAPNTPALGTILFVYLRFWRQDSNEPAEWSLKSNGLVKWWNPATQRFDAGAAVWTSLPATTTTTALEKCSIGIANRPFPDTEDLGTLTLSIRQADGGTVLRTNRFAYASVDKPTYGASGIPNGGPWPCDTSLAETRGQCALMLNGPNGLIPATEMTMVAVVTPGFSAGLAIAYIPLFAFHTTTVEAGSGWLYVRYDDVAGLLKVRCNFGSGIVESSCAWTPATDTPARVAVRVKAGVLSTFVNGVKGTDAALLDAWPAGSRIFVGSAVSLLAISWPGSIDPWGISPSAWTDSQIANWGI
jgi:hypothetical protein